MHRWIMTLRQGNDASPSLLGSKAANLAQLLAHGLPVPEGFVVTTEAFDTQATEELEQALFEGFDATFAPDQLVAVRSSAVDEDGSHTSFAGQHQTYYFINRAGLVAAVHNCWRSLHSDQAVAYRRELGDQVAGKMAVLIQQMLNPEAAGVCFTKDPVPESRGHTIVQSTFGLGAALVDGRVTPDHFAIDEKRIIRAQRVGRKHHRVVARVSASDEARLEPLPSNDRYRASINEEQAKAIAQLSWRCREYFGAEQDIEWAYEKGELYLLQSRPITATDTFPSVTGRWVIFKPIVENFHEPLTPLTIDITRRVMLPVGRFIEGRYYLDFDAVKKLIPLKLSDSTLFELLLFRKVDTKLAIDWKKILPATAMAVYLYFTLGIFLSRTTRTTPKQLARYKNLCEAVKANPNLDPLAAIHRLFYGRHPFEPIGHRPLQTNISAGRYFILSGLLKVLTNRWAPAFDQTQLAALCTGAQDALSTQLVEEIRQLAAIASKNKAIVRVLGRGIRGELLTDLNDIIEGTEFQYALEKFMHKFGHRCTRELDFSAPRWSEDATPVLNMIRNFAVEPDKKIDAHGLRLAAQDNLHQAVKSKWKRWLLDQLVNKIRFFVSLRENTRFYHSMMFQTVRGKILEIEQTLISRGQLHCADDIFFLHWEEIGKLRTGEWRWQNAEPVIRQRRKRYLIQSSQLPAEQYNIDLIIKDPNGQLSGQCACPGAAKGRARIIRDPSVDGVIQHGDIIVAPYTDPTWTPLFPKAGAIVVEIGSYLSHAGTVAREYGIPCVVDVRGALATIQDGQQLHVDATAGTITLGEGEQ